MRLPDSRLCLVSFQRIEQMPDDAVVRFGVDRVTQVLDHSFYVTCTFHDSASPFNMDRNLSIPYR